MQTSESITIPPAGTSRPIDDMLHTAFVVAVEGGINYWVDRIDGYHWQGEDGEPDLAGFTATLSFEDPYAAGQLERQVDRDVIAEGFIRLAQGPCEYMPERQRHMFLALLHARLAGFDDNRVDIDYDAGEADNLVQVALFGKVIFG